MEHPRLEIKQFNQLALIQLIEALQSEKEIDDILQGFSNDHELVKDYIDQCETLSIIDLLKFKHSINALFNDVDLDIPKEEQRIFTIMSLLLICLKYQLNIDVKKEGTKGRGKVSSQKKYFEVLSKYKREKRKHPAVTGAKKLGAYLINLDFSSIKRVNSILGKNKRSESGMNLAFFSRLLFDIVRINSKHNLSDNEIILKMYDFYRILYPEFKLLATEEEWLIAHSSIAIGDHFRSYRQKSIKSIIYYSNKNMFKDNRDKLTLDAITNLVEIIQKDDSVE